MSDIFQVFCWQLTFLKVPLFGLCDVFQSYQFAKTESFGFGRDWHIEVGLTVGILWKRLTNDVTGFSGPVLPRRGSLADRLPRLRPVALEVLVTGKGAVWLGADLVAQPLVRVRDHVTSCLAVGGR